MDYTLIPVKKILDIIDDPFGRWATGKVVPQQMVLDALQDGSYGLAKDSYSDGGNVSVMAGTAWHARRIAYLMKNGWEDSIDLDVGIPSLGYYPYPLIDGHHRLCAAIMLGDTTIKAQVSGALDYAFELFGVDCALHTQPEKVDV
jgi:hypothetical protein